MTRRSSVFTNMQRKQKGGLKQAIGRSRGGLTTKIHAVVDEPHLICLIPVGTRAMHRGATLFNSSTAKRALDQMLTSGMEEPDSSGKERLLGVLTERETEVVQLLAYGKKTTKYLRFYAFLKAQQKRTSTIS